MFQLETKLEKHQKHSSVRDYIRDWETKEILPLPGHYAPNKFQDICFLTASEEKSFKNQISGKLTHPLTNQEPLGSNKWQKQEAGSRKQKTPGSDKDQNLNFSYFSQSPFISLSLFCLIINLKNEETRDTLLTRTQNLYLKIENWHNKMENKYAKSMEEYLNCKQIQRRMKNQ